MADAVQLSFPWADPAKPAKPHAVLIRRPSSTFEEILPTGTKWDFETTFPEPLPDAFLPIEDAYEMGEEAVAAVHEEHTRHCLAILQDSRIVGEAIRTGVDPRTGKLPKTQNGRDRLSRNLGKASKDLASEFEQMLGAYVSAFGIEAGDAFRAYLLRREAEFAAESQESVQPGAQKSPQGDGEGGTPSGIPASKSLIYPLAAGNQA